MAPVIIYWGVKKVDKLFGPPGCAAAFYAIWLADKFAKWLIGKAIAEASALSQ